MLRFLSIPVLAFVLALTAPQMAEAKSYAGLAGKYTGVLIIAQGTGTRIVGNANVVASKSGNIVVKGSVNSVSFTQTYKLGPGSKASVSTLLPGISSFNQSLSGRVSGSGKTANIVGSFQTTAKGGSSSPGKMKVKITKITFGGTISIQSIVTFENGADPVYVTITAS